MDGSLGVISLAGKKMDSLENSLELFVEPDGIFLN